MLCVIPAHESVDILLRPLRIQRNLSLNDLLDSLQLLQGE